MKPIHKLFAKIIQHFRKFLLRTSPVPLAIMPISFLIAGMTRMIEGTPVPFIMLVVQILIRTVELIVIGVSIMYLGWILGKIWYALVNWSNKCLRESDRE